MNRRRAFSEARRFRLTAGIGLLLLLLVSGNAASQRRGGQTSAIEQSEERLNELAKAYALTGRALDPIPLDRDRPELGVALLPIHRKVLVARAQLDAGELPEPPIETGRDPDGPGILVIAFPIACDGRVARAQQIVHIGRTRPGRSGPVRTMRRGIAAEEISTLAPGLGVPDGALGATFYNRVFTPDGAVILRYDGASCPDLGPELHLPVDLQRPRQIQEVHAPESPEPGAVRMRALIDVDGTPRAVAVVEGAPTLHYEALLLAAGWRFLPARINGEPVPHPVGFRIRFGSGGR